MSEASLYQCSRCGMVGLCTQNIIGEHHRILVNVGPWENDLTDEQRALAKVGRLARVYLCGTWTRAPEGVPAVPIAR